MLLLPKWIAADAETAAQLDELTLCALTEEYLAMCMLVGVDPGKLTVELIAAELRRSSEKQG